MYTYTVKHHGLGLTEPYEPTTTESGEIADTFADALASAMADIEDLIEEGFYILSTTMGPGRYHATLGVLHDDSHLGDGIEPCVTITIERLED